MEKAKEVAQDIGTGIKRATERVGEAIKGDTATQHGLKADLHKETAKSTADTAPGFAVKEGFRAAGEKIQEKAKEFKHGA